MQKFIPGKTRLMTSRQVRRFDFWAINELGIPGVVLMENAGRSCAELIKRNLSEKAEPKVCIFCGTGNNGGDGFVIARHLINGGFKVGVAICGDIGKIKGDAGINLDLLAGIGQQIDTLNISESGIEEKVKGFAADADMIVDAIFGTGLKGRLRPEYIRLIETINSCNRPILAVDIPSGLDCDTGEPLAAAIKAKYTVTFVAAKTGFAGENAGKYTGEIYIASIGAEPSE